MDAKAFERAAADSDVGCEALGDLYEDRVRALQVEAGYDGTGSHYTPASMVVPMVEASLSPLLAEAREWAGPLSESILSLRVCDPAMGAGAFLVEVCRWLGDALYTARVSEGSVAAEDEAARRSCLRDVADSCVHGVDINPVAVNMARVVLWLQTDVRGVPRARLRARLRHGDGLLGLNVAQILDWTWEPRDALEKTAPAAFRSQLRTRANAMVAAYFAGADEKERQGLLAQFRTDLLVCGSDEMAASRIRDALRTLRSNYTALHWPLAFPDVFNRERAGFDAFVGNPPFVGGFLISASIGRRYRQWLVDTFSNATGRVDLSTYFFRRAFDLLRPGGTLGFITTSSVSKGDNRAAGLRVIKRQGGTIYRAYTNAAWPQRAEVLVSLVHIAKGNADGPYDLNGREVDRISAFLLGRGGDDDPVPMIENQSRVSHGFTTGAHGTFLFDDSQAGAKRGAAPKSRACEIIESEPKSTRALDPYMNGHDLNQHPAQLPSRYLINFGHCTLEEAKEYPALLDEVRSRADVPEDERYGGWWKTKDSGGYLTRLRRYADRVLVCATTTPHFAFVFVPTRFVVASSALCFRLREMEAFGVLQSEVHQAWARRFSSLRNLSKKYLLGMCFDAFPLPRGWREAPALFEAGARFYRLRNAIMTHHGEGLTSTHNRYHHPDLLDRTGDPPMVPEAYLKLRELSAEMDRAVLAAYGWDDLQPEYDFHPNLAVAPDDREASIRYRWSDEVEAEIVARLMERNAERVAEDERLFG